MKRIFMACLFGLLLALLVIPGAQAQGEDPDTTVITGIVISVDDTAGTFELQLKPDVSMTIYFAEGVDRSVVVIGATAVVDVYIDENGRLVATGISVEDDDPDPTVEVTPTITATPVVTSTPVITATPEITTTPVVTTTPFTNNGAFCSDLQRQHPVGSRIADTYGVPYEEVMGWFCRGQGFGEIMLALQTAQLVEDYTAADLIDMKNQIGGWGQVWHALGLVKNKGQAEPPAHGRNKKNQSTATPVPGDGLPEATPEPDVETGEPSGEDRPGNNGNKGNNGNNGNNQDKNKDKNNPGVGNSGSAPTIGPGDQDTGQGSSAENPGPPGQQKDKKNKKPNPGKGKGKGKP